MNNLLTIPSKDPLSLPEDYTEPNDLRQQDATTVESSDGSFDPVVSEAVPPVVSETAPPDDTQLLPDPPDFEPPQPRGRPFQPGATFGRGRPKGARNRYTADAEAVLELRATLLAGKCTE